MQRGARDEREFPRSNIVFGEWADYVKKYYVTPLPALLNQKLDKSKDGGTIFEAKPKKKGKKKRPPRQMSVVLSGNVHR